MSEKIRASISALRYDFLRCGWWIGPWFLRDELRHRIWGWWPPEARRRRDLQSQAKAWSEGYRRGLEAGREEAFKHVEKLIEQTFGAKP